MELVSVHQLKPGDVVGAPVTNSSGAVLCPTGYVLSQEAIDQLLHAGVEAAAIMGGRLDVPSVEDRLAQLDARFEGVSDPVLLQVKACIAQYQRDRHV